MLVTVMVACDDNVGTTDPDDNGGDGNGDGVEGSCTQVVGPMPTPTAIARFEYYDCGNQGVTDGGTGPNAPPGCTKIRP